MGNLTDYVPPFGDTCCNMEAKRSREAFFAPYILLARPQDFRFLLPDSLFSVSDVLYIRLDRTQNYRATCTATVVIEPLSCRFFSGLGFVFYIINNVDVLCDRCSTVKCSRLIRTTATRCLY